MADFNPLAIDQTPLQDFTPSFNPFEPAPSPSFSSQAAGGAINPRANPFGFLTNIIQGQRALSQDEEAKRLEFERKQAEQEKQHKAKVATLMNLANKKGIEIDKQTAENAVLAGKTIKDFVESTKSHRKVAGLTEADGKKIAVSYDPDTNTFTPQVLGKAPPKKSGSDVSPGLKASLLRFVSQQVMQHFPSAEPIQLPDGSITYRLKNADDVKKAQAISERVMGKVLNGEQNIFNALNEAVSELKANVPMSDVNKMDHVAKTVNKIFEEDTGQK